MSQPSRVSLFVLIAAFLAVIVFLLTRCSRPDAETKTDSTHSQSPAIVVAEASAKSGPDAPDAPTGIELLTSATLAVPPQIVAGSAFPVTWTGPDNKGDYVTIVATNAPATAYRSYAETRTGKALTLTAPVEPGDWEVRYVTSRSKTILARAPIRVTPAPATLTASDRIILGASVSINWTGPNNPGDYITIVAKDTPDGGYQNYAETAKGSPLTVAAPVEPVPAEVRYMTAGNARVLARRPIEILSARVTLEAPAQVVAGSRVHIAWSGPANRGDYITIVPLPTPDGRYANYTDISKGSPLQVPAPMREGVAEIRYMSGQGAKVLGRRSIEIVGASITLNAPAMTVTGSVVSVDWTGPDNAGDYLTIVPKTARSGHRADITATANGSPAKVIVPNARGHYEIRYMSGQGHRVLARAELEVAAPETTDPISGLAGNDARSPRHSPNTLTASQ